MYSVSRSQIFDSYYKRHSLLRHVFLVQKGAYLPKGLRGNNILGNTQLCAVGGFGECQVIELCFYNLSIRYGILYSIVAKNLLNPLAADCTLGV
jgi:hypothetical protein